MTIKDIYKLIDKIAPFSHQEKWDNSGMLIGDETTVVNKALLALDVTPNVISEAKSIGANLIITHHPVIFDGIKSVKGNSIPFQLINSGIGVISAHTNLDVAVNGVNKALCEAVKLCDITPLLTSKTINSTLITLHVPTTHTEKVLKAMGESGGGKIGNYKNCSYTIYGGTGRFTPTEGAIPYIGAVDTAEEVIEDRIEILCENHLVSQVVSALKSAHPYEVPSYYLTENKSYSVDIPLGFIGTLAESITARELASKVKSALGADIIRVTNGDKIVNKVAVCGGSGGSLIGLASGKGADAYITGDLKHDQIVDSLNSGLALIDGGHFFTENAVLPVLAKELSALTNKVEFIVTSTSCPYETV